MPILFFKSPIGEYEPRLLKGSTLDTNQCEARTFLIIRSASFLPTDLVVLWDKDYYDMIPYWEYKKDLSKRIFHFLKRSIRGTPFFDEYGLSFYVFVSTWI